MCPLGRGFSSVFARKRSFEREAARKAKFFDSLKKRSAPQTSFPYSLRQHKVRQHGDTEDNPIPAEHLEIVLLDEAHQETDDEQ